MMHPPQAVSEEQLLAQSRYRCCCGSCNVKCGTWTIAILEAILLSLSIAMTVAAFIIAKAKVSVLTLVIYIIISHGLGFIIVLCLFIGLTSKKGGFLLVYIIYMILQVFWIVIAFIVVVIAFFFGGIALLVDKEGGEQQENKALALALIIVCLVFLAIGLFFSCWQTSIVMRCRQFFNELASSKLPPVYYHHA